jgi:hypothetical protein
VRQWFNDGTGVLGQFTNQASNTSGGTAGVDVEVTILNTGRYRRRFFHFEPNLTVQVGVGAANPPYNTAALPTLFRIKAFVQSTGLLTLERVQGNEDITQVGTLPNGTNNVYIQDSRNADFLGLLGFCFDTTFNGIASQYRYQPYAIPGLTNNEFTSALDLDLFNRAVNGLATQTGEAPTHCLLSPVQMRILISLFEDRGINVTPIEIDPSSNAPSSTRERYKKTGFGGYSALKYISAAGSVIVMEHRMVRDDMALFVNVNHLSQRYITMPEWYDGDGNKWHRFQDKDAGAAFYRAYGENIIHPFHMTYLQGLSTTE